MQLPWADRVDPWLELLHLLIYRLYFVNFDISPSFIICLLIDYRHFFFVIYIITIHSYFLIRRWFIILLLLCVLLIRPFLANHPATSRRRSRLIKNTFVILLLQVFKHGFTYPSVVYFVQLRHINIKYLSYPMIQSIVGDYYLEPVFRQVL